MLLSVNNLHTVLESSGGDVHAVRGIDLQLQRGQTLCLVGESGSGKSVTALSVMRLLPETIASHPQGTIELADSADADSGVTDLLAIHSSRMASIRGNRMAMIFQEPMSSLNPVYTVGEQIAEAILFTRPELPPSEAESIALQALRDVRIDKPESRFKDYPHRLSGGQRQRVMIAMALACKPDLLIADEPTTALDVTVQSGILKLISELQQETRMGVLFITHDLGVVAQIADTVAVMKDGKIVEQGRCEEVLYRPEHTYTRRLLGSLPENLERLSEVLPTAEPILEVSQLNVQFPVRSGLLRRVSSYVRAVDDVSLSINNGEIMALVGESGSGKSTLGRAIVRLLKPTSGIVRYRGQDIGSLSTSELRPLRTDLQVVFQDPLSSLNPRLNIITTLTEPMAVHGIGESPQHRESLARQLLTDVNLPEDTLWRYPHEFSGGQRQRIGIARALAVNPKLVVCDEVTSALDVSVQAEILELLLNLRSRFGLTLLFITHNISVVEYISDKTAVMHQGRLVEIGSTPDVCGNPQHEYTRKLIDAVPRLGERRYLSAAAGTNR